MAVVQISRIQHRRGTFTDLPQLAAGELGWAIDEQRLFIGNGPVSEGAPASSRILSDRRRDCRRLPDMRSPVDQAGSAARRGLVGLLLPD